MSKCFYETEEHSKFYAQCRPNYPSDLINKIFDYLKEKYDVKETDLALDVGCGTGQSTILLANIFQQVIGYDISQSQVDKANATNTFPNVHYRKMPSNKLPHDDSSVALIISAQAAHWFDMEEFYSEAKRILKTNGVLAFIGYAFVHIHGEQEQELNSLVEDFYNKTLDGYVQNESKQVYFGRYRDKKFQIPWSIEDFIRDETSKIVCRWSIRRLIGYILSWSGSQNYLKQYSDSRIFRNLSEQIVQILGAQDDSHELDLSFDIFILMNRKSN